MRVELRVATGCLRSVFERGKYLRACIGGSKQPANLGSKRHSSSQNGASSCEESMLVPPIFSRTELVLLTRFGSPPPEQGPASGKSRLGGGVPAPPDWRLGGSMPPTSVIPVPGRQEKQSADAQPDVLEKIQLHGPVRAPREDHLSRPPFRPPKIKPSGRCVEVRRLGVVRRRSRVTTNTVARGEGHSSDLWPTLPTQDRVVGDGSLQVNRHGSCASSGTASPDNYQPNEFRRAYPWR